MSVNKWSPQKWILGAPKMLCWLVGFLLVCFCHLDTTWSHLGSGNLRWGIAFLRLACGEWARHFRDWRLRWEGPSYCRWCCPWVGGPGVCKKANWANLEEQPSKQHSSVPSTSLPPPSFLEFLPRLLFMIFVVFYSMALRQNKPSPPCAAFSHGVLL